MCLTVFITLLMLTGLATYLGLSASGEETPRLAAGPPS
jgi:hypothetical protein